MIIQTKPISAKWQYLTNCEDIKNYHKKYQLSSLFQKQPLPNKNKRLKYTQAKGIKKNMNTGLQIFAMSMIPFLDVKFAVPMALGKQMPLIKIFLITFTGSMIPAAIYLAILGPTSKFMMARFTFWKNLGDKIFHKTRKTHTKNFNRYGALLIIVLVGLPIPGSGSISGSTVAWLFNVEYKKALFLVALGSAISILLLLTGFGSIFKIIQSISG